MVMANIKILIVGTNIDLDNVKEYSDMAYLLPTLSACISYICTCAFRFCHQFVEVLMGAGEWLVATWAGQLVEHVHVLVHVHVCTEMMLHIHVFMRERMWWNITSTKLTEGRPAGSTRWVDKINIVWQSLVFFIFKHITVWSKHILNRDKLWF